ncbi:MAG: LamG domain-containing protein [Kofleriaceae bacterium]
MRGVLVAALLLTGCGRFGFDSASGPPPGDDDTPPDTQDLTALFQDCLAHYAMDEAEWTGASGEVLDTCGGHHGTASGGATTIADDIRGRAGVFVGDPSCVQVADASGLQPIGAMTASAWILPTALSPLSFGVLSRRDDFGVNAAYSLFIWTDNFGTGSTNQLYVDIDGENDRVPDPNATFLNEWHQVTVVYDGSLASAGRVQFYVDGEPSFTAPETSSTIAPNAGSPPLSIGCLPLTNPAQSFIGRIDDVALWNRALDAADVGLWYAVTRR